MDTFTDAATDAARLLADVRARHLVLVHELRAAARAQDLVGDAHESRGDLNASLLCSGRCIGYGSLSDLIGQGFAREAAARISAPGYASLAQDAPQTFAFLSDLAARIGA